MCVRLGICPGTFSNRLLELNPVFLQFFKRLVSQKTVGKKVANRSGANNGSGFGIRSLVRMLYRIREALNGTGAGADVPIRIHGSRFASHSPNRAPYRSKSPNAKEKREHLFFYQNRAGILLLKLPKFACKSGSGFADPDLSKKTD
jgi:hypothetical protein